MMLLLRLGIINEGLKSIEHDRTKNADYVQCVERRRVTMKDERMNQNK